MKKGKKRPEKVHRNRKKVKNELPHAGLEPEPICTHANYQNYYEID